MKNSLKNSLRSSWNPSQRNSCSTSCLASPSPAAAASSDAAASPAQWLSRVAFTLVVATLCVPVTASAGRLRTRAPRLHRELSLRTSAPLLGPGILLDAAMPLPLTGRKYELHLFHLHTGERLDVVYRIGDTYIPDALDELNHFLRDHRNEAVSQYDPAEFDLLHNLMTRLRKPNGEIDIVCGYRSPESNEYLRSLSADTGVAEHSQHIQAKAIDIRVPGVRTLQLRNAALSLGAGGVGYYPRSQFVHVDVGPVREWSFGTRTHRHASRTHHRIHRA